MVRVKRWKIPLAAGAAGAGLAAWAVRGRSSSVFGPSVWHGPRTSNQIAITFDDGPSESTPDVLDLLARYSIPATFFQCGVNAIALPAVAREVAARGHEIGNHSHTHTLLAMKTPLFVRAEFELAQQAIHDATGVTPALLRVPYGVRWFGLRDLPLTAVMWDVIGLDWKLPGQGIADRILTRARGGSILCLHDGRELDRSASIENTLQALRWILPALLDRGFEFRTVTQFLCKTK